MNSYFYSGQTRRFLQQFIRILSNFQVSMGTDDEGDTVLMTVPIYYGDSSRQVATILRNNSENSLSSVPAMSVYISGWRYDQKRMQEPFFVSKMNLRYRDVDENGQLTNTVGDAVTVERLMPVPYNLTIKVDIWTSNIDQKLQLLEQIAVLFNPSLEIQSTDNYVDWTSLTYVTLTDTNFTSRTVPVGTEDPLDIASLTFDLPVWFSAPAKVKNMGVIQKIITSLWDSVGTINQSEGSFDINASTLMARQVYTLFNFNLLYIGNTIKLLNSTAQQGFSAGVTTESADGFEWPVALKNFGQLVNGISQVRLDQGDITIIGTVAYHPTDPTMLLFTPIMDTMPANNLDPVNAIIDPTNVTVDSTLLNPVAGTRYLILDNIGRAGSESPALWSRVGYPALVAEANDIIRFTGTHWVVDFDSSATTSVKYLTNLRTNIQYKWKDQQWTKAVEGRYGAGAWSFVP
jgi:hypothetical protein